MIKVAVVILNWNGKQLLADFLPSVISNLPEYAEVIVADNDSKDDSIAFLKKKYPQIRIIKNNENGGFAKGYNDALQHVEAEYFVLLNSDIEVTQQWIEPIIELMDKNADIAACQPKILWHRDKAYFEYAGASGGFIDRWGYPFCRGRVFQHLEKDLGQYNTVQNIFWASGACMFIRAELFKKNNGFDAEYFAHMEEIDLCWRLQRQGYRITACPDSVVYHVGGATLNKSNPKKTYLNFRNSLYTLIKNTSPYRLFFVLFIRFGLDLIAALKFLVTDKPSDFIAVFKAYVSALKNFGNMYGKRKNYSNTKKIKLHGIYKKSIVFSHYLQGKKLFSELKKDIVK